MPRTMTANQWQHAKSCSRWLVAYLDALRNRRSVSLLQPDFCTQLKLCDPTRAHVSGTRPE